MNAGHDSHDPPVHPWELAVLQAVTPAGGHVIDVRDEPGAPSRVALLARLVGPGGHVSAFEADPVDREKLTGAAAAAGLAQVDLHEAVPVGAAAARLDDLPIQVLSVRAGGSEHAVVDGLSELVLRHRPVLLVDLHPDAVDRGGADPVAVLAYYRGLGYSVTVVGRTDVGDATPDTQLVDVVCSMPGARATLLLRPGPTPPRPEPLAPLVQNDSEARRARRHAVDAVPFWFHSIDVGVGVRTPGLKTRSVLANEWRDMRIDDIAGGGLSGRSVLDVGAWDGFFSFAAEEAGADRVVALDEYVWRIDRSDGDRISTGTPGRAGFDLARQMRGSSVEPLVADIATLDPSDVGTFDVVFFLGVLYHLKDPLGGLAQAAALTSGCCVIETQAVVAPGDHDLRMWEFHPRDELNGDPTNWFVPTMPALIGACEAVGFSRVEILRGPTVGPIGGQNGQYRALVRAWV